MIGSSSAYYANTLDSRESLISGERIPSREPMTPRARPMDEIQVDARKRFAGVLWISKDSDRAIEDYFSDYDFWEPYSETKSYSKRSYTAGYKGVLKEYKSYLCILSHEEDGMEKEEYYVVAIRMRTELETLEPWCTCTSCSACIINPLKYLWCPFCTKCIKAGAGFADPSLIAKARNLKLQSYSKKSPSKFDQLKWIKLIEYASIFLVFSLFVYYLF